MNLLPVLGGLAGLLVLPLGFSVAFGIFLAYKLYHPYRRPGRAPDLSGLDVRRVRIPSGRGVELDGMFLQGTGQEHLILIAHEIGSFKESKLKLARRLLAEGYNVLLFDLRNHGGSSKDRSWWPMSERFTDDIESALAYAGKTFPAIAKTTLLTFSFSTFPSLYIIRRGVRQPDSIILDSGPSPRVDNLYGKFLDEIGKAFVPRLFRLPPLYGPMRSAFRYFGLKMLATTWPPDFSKVRSRVLFIVNGRDPVFPMADIKVVADQIRRSRVWLCRESDHLQAYKVDPEGYMQALVGFLAEPATGS